jgi:hypothetical protein
MTDTIAPKKTRPTAAEKAAIMNMVAGENVAGAADTAIPGVVRLHLNLNGVEDVAQAFADFRLEVEAAAAGMDGTTVVELSVTPEGWAATLRTLL